MEVFRDDYRLSGADQDFGERPWRATGSVEYNLSEFSRIRVQYNHDRSGRDGVTNNEVLVQLIFGIGAHSAHPF